MNVTRKISRVFGSEAGGNLALALVLVAMIAIFDWSDYHEGAIWPSSGSTLDAERHGTDKGADRPPY